MEENIKLNTVKKVIDFSNKILLFEDDIDIRTVDSPSNVFDAKSLMSLFCLDLSKYLIIKINTSNKDSIERFRILAQQFKD